MSQLTKAIKLWLPFAVVGAALVLLIYVGIQQEYRQSANDPQIQMAEDAAAAIGAGATPQSQLPSQTINVATSLAPFVIIVDKNGSVLASSATLNGSTPIPPKGSLNYTVSSSHFPGDQPTNENRFTWQPQSDVRIATVIVPYSGKSSGYVIVGRNLREVEQRESILTLMAGLDFLGLLIGSFLIILVTI